MSILPRRVSTRLALVALVVVALVVVVVLSFVLRDGEVPAPTDGIGDIPTAHLVPEDVALYVALGADLDSPAWANLFALLERLGVEDPLGQVREGFEEETDVDWDEAIEPFLGGAAVLFLSSFNSGDDGPRGAVIFRARDARGAEAVILRRRGDGFVERDYRGVSYKVMEEGGVLAVIGEHFVYAAGEPSLHDIVDAQQGETRSLAASDDFRRLRNALAGEALAFLYLHPGSFLSELREEAPEGEEPDPLALVGLDDLFSRPVGVVVRSAGDSLRLQAVALGDPGPFLPLLRPRESRFAALVPAETTIFVSTANVAGAMDEFFGESELADRLRDAVLESADDNGALARFEDALSLLEGEVAFAIWTSADGELTETVLLAEVDDEDRARELLGELLADSLAAAETVLSVEDGIAIIASSDAAIETIRSASDSTLANSKRYSAALARLDAPLGAFVYVDIWRLIAAGADEFADLDLDGDALGLIVTLALGDDYVEVEGVLTTGGGD